MLQDSALIRIYFYHNVNSGPLESPNYIFLVTILYCQEQAENYHRNLSKKPDPCLEDDNKHRIKNNVRLT